MPCLTFVLVTVCLDLWVAQMEADEKEAFVAYLEIETEGSCRRGPFFARMRCEML